MPLPRRVEIHVSLIPNLTGYELVLEHKVAGEKVSTEVRMPISSDQLFLRVQEQLNNQLRMIVNKLEARK